MVHARSTSILLGLAFMCGELVSALPAHRSVAAAAPPSTQNGFNVTSMGTGSFTGLSYCVPAHTSGTIKTDIQIMALTSDNIKQLNELIMSFLSASKRDNITDFQKTHVSADISIWSIFGGGASASYDHTHQEMHTMGLTDDQISTIIEKFADLASKMSHVKLDFNVDNTAFDYQVCGDLQLWTMSGTIKTAKGTQEYRMLANRGKADQAPATAPAGGGIIPLGR